MIFLQGQGFYLRGLSTDDVNDDYVSWFNDEEVCRFNSHHRYPRTSTDQRNYISSIQSKDLVLAILVNKKHIGNVALIMLDEISRVAELSIIIGDKKYWHKGFGQQACALVVKHAFEQLNVHRIELGCMTEAVAMRAIATSLGFKQEGIAKAQLYKNGKHHDIIRFALLR